MKMSISLLLMFLAVLFAGCSNNVYYTSDMLPDTKVDKNKNVKVFVSDDATIEEKKMKSMIEKKLIENGYKVDSSKTFDYVIIYKLTEDSFTTSKVETDYVPTTSYSTGYVDGKYTTTSTISQVPDTYARTITKIYKKNYFKMGDLRQIAIWEGFISADKPVYDNNTDDIIDNIIKLIGKDFKGYLEIDQK